MDAVEGGAVGVGVEARHDPWDRPQVVDQSTDIADPHGCVPLPRARDGEADGLELGDGERQVEVGACGDRAAERTKEVVVPVAALAARQADAPPGRSTRATSLGQ